MWMLWVTRGGGEGHGHGEEKLEIGPFSLPTAGVEFTAFVEDLERAAESLGAAGTADPGRTRFSAAAH